MEDNLQVSVQRSFDAILATTERESAEFVEALRFKCAGRWGTGFSEVQRIEEKRLEGLRNVLARMAWSLTH